MTVPHSKTQQKGLPKAALMTLAHRAWREGASPETLYELIDQASEEGASRVLEELGLKDGRASGDIGELRTLLEGWREAKRTLRQTVIRWLIRFLLTSLLLGLAIKMKILNVGQFFGGMT
ncbi:DUF6127 family protein [Luteithermobacter gelatinilyticus]|uniref:DUF6127 family protein n=1 Tax=Luteithermobacter gelatinilyticus TaxID=2582913 RepID=UPI001AEF7FFA|nr:DUF6127 family protein [Luteithermobacter gelatinilyticus]|tara:strand:+ start:3664 stop:4023 length:360 start_codon:yes stop_codon:yes gene_type:complete